MKKEIGIHELFKLDPERADYLLWGRRSDPLSRRGFVKGLAGLTGVIGAGIVYQHTMPAGLIPAVFANTEEEFVIEGKNGLRVLNDRPLNAETPAHLLNDDITPVERLFIRNNGVPPAGADADAWTRSARSLTLRTSVLSTPPIPSYQSSTLYWIHSGNVPASLTGPTVSAWA